MDSSTLQKFAQLFTQKPQAETQPSQADFVKLLTGMTGDELGSVGREVYPEEDATRNQQAHRLGARLLTNRFGVLPAQALGLANEGYEFARVGHAQGDELGDIGANVRGSIDAAGDNLNTPWGLVKMIKMLTKGTR